MLQNARQSLIYAFCSVIALDIVVLLGGPLFLDSADSNPDCFYSEFEFELEENEDCEEETLIQDVDFSSGVSQSHSLVVSVDFCINESERDECHVTRGPPTLC